MGKGRKIVYLGAAIVILLVIYYSFSSALVSYEAIIDKERKDKDEYFSLDADSPLTDASKEMFSRLSYFPTNEKYKVRASLEKIEGQVQTSMATNDGKEQQYIKYAYATFELDGEEQRLLLLKPDPPEDEEYLFLAFGDATSGDGTYGGGRYIDLELTSNKKLTIDFNKAYNPFCAYSEGYSCPLPPPENLLDVAIIAGEKDFILP